MKLPASLSCLHQRVDKVLDDCLLSSDHQPKSLHQAMRYTTLAKGKRMRPILVYLSGQALGASLDMLDPPACAVELIHSYSLIHDDLPAMDNDDLRRDQASCHKVFGEAIAILAGDTLQSLAFQLLAEQPLLSAQQQLAMIRTLAKASGSLGMAGGQVLDLSVVKAKITLDELEHIHRLKTGALLTASVRLGNIVAQCKTTKFTQDLEKCAHYLGLAFQIQDDLLDKTSNTETIGKPQNFDEGSNKPNYLTLTSLAQAKNNIKHFYDQAITAICHLPETANKLRSFIEWLAQRAY